MPFRYITKRTTTGGAPTLCSCVCTLLLIATGVAAIGRAAFPLLTLVAAAGVAIRIAISKLPKKVEKVEDCDINEEDIISKLPDDILRNIVSRLQSIDAVRTSILSRRWRYIHTFTSRLMFNCLDMFGQRSMHTSAGPKYFRRFVNVVDQTLKLHSGQKITYVRMVCCFAGICVSDFRRWMHSFLGLGVEELDCQFLCLRYPDGRYMIPCLFVFPFDLLYQAVSLKHLHLTGCALPTSFEGHFRYLETLDFQFVEMQNGELPGILSSCINLQHVKLTRCILPQELCISGHCLRIFIIDSCVGMKIIDLEAVNLTAFECYAHCAIKYMFPCLPKLEQVSVVCDCRAPMPDIFGEVAKHCPNLKTMLLQTIMNDELPCRPGKMNMFSKLRQLELLMVFNRHADLLDIALIIGACPILEKLRLLARRPIPSGAASWPVTSYVHLKEVAFLGFGGTRDQIRFLSFLVRSSPALHLLILQPYYDLYIGEGERLREFVAPVNSVFCDLIYKDLVRQAFSSTLDVVFKSVPVVADASFLVEA